MRRRAWRWTRWWRVVRNNGTLVAVSLVLALLIWFLITDAQSGTVEEPLGFSLTVRAVNTPSGLEPANRFPTALITVVGREPDIAAVTAEDFAARVDLTDLAAGSHVVPVGVDSLTDDVRVRSVAPQSIEVILEPILERALSVTVVVANPPPLGFEVEEPELSLATVMVSGIQRLVDLVDVVVAPIDVTGATVDIDLPVALQARTSTGAIVGGVRIEPPTVAVRVSIRQVLFRRAVAITPDLVGQVASGYRVTSITVDPLSAVVVGTLTALEGLETLPTEPVPVAGAMEAVVMSVAILAPDGIALEEGAGVRVRVQVEPVTVQAVFDLPVEVRNLAAGLVVDVLPDRAMLTVQGPAPLVAALVDASFRVSVTADALTPGVHIIPLQVSFAAGLEVVGVWPETVTLIVRQAPPETETEVGAASGGGSAP